MKSKLIYLTTTLPYVNSVPHIGHALEFLQADANFKNLKFAGHDVLFNVGIDEHGQKVWESAKKEGIEVQEYVDQLAEKWKNFCSKLNIQYSNFYRTSSPKHKEQAATMFQYLLNKGDIYKKQYKGLYCSGCESFKTEKDLIEGKCSDHPTTEIQIIEEENYFFRLSKYQNHLREWINKNPDFLQPESKINELKNFIETIEDISVSRLKANLPWGISVPGDNTQVIYVWFEALLNYIFSCDTQERWKNSIQICGPDNLRFQAVIWQGILAALGFEQTSKLLVHGTILDKEGNKMSKSLGNVIDPIEQVDKFGITAVRYYALAGINTFGNAGWSESELTDLYNSHLADDYGNLIARTLHLVDQYQIEVEPEFVDPEFILNFSKKKKKVEDLLDSHELKEAALLINSIVKDANKYISEEEPWKKEENRKTVLNNLYWVLVNLIFLYHPFIPDKTEEIREALKLKKKKIIFIKIK